MLYFLKMGALLDLLKVSQRKFDEKIVGIEFKSEDVYMYYL